MQVGQPAPGLGPSPVPRNPDKPRSQLDPQLRAWLLSLDLPSSRHSVSDQTEALTDQQPAVRWLPCRVDLLLSVVTPQLMHQELLLHSHVLLHVHSNMHRLRAGGHLLRHF